MISRFTKSEESKDSGLKYIASAIKASVLFVIAAYLFMHGHETEAYFCFSFGIWV